MNNVDKFGDTKHRINLEYLLDLEQQLENCKNSDKHYQDHALRVLRMKISILRKRLMKK